MNAEVNTARIWIFRVLVTIAIVTMIVSFIQPWWLGRFGGSEAIKIHGWGLRHNLTNLSNFVAGDLTPAWQTALAWVYLGISAMAALLSTWIKKFWGSVLLGISGAGFIAYALIAVLVVISNRLDSFSILLEGRTIMGSGVIIDAKLQSGYYLAFVAGGLMIVLAILRRVIVGKQPQIEQPSAT